MLTSVFRKRITAVMASAVLCAGLGAVALTASGGSAVADDATSSSDKTTMQEWGEKYPLEWNSYHQKPVKADGLTHGHFDLQERLLAPVVRDGTSLIKSEDGYYQISGFSWNEEIGAWVIDEDELGAVPANAFKMGCYSCKSSNFNEAYEQWGAEIFVEEPTQEFIDLIDGQIWDCASCHDGDPGTSEPDAQLTYWTQLSREHFDEFDSSERVCGQCHNSFDYRSHITSQEVMDSFDPYQYGFDVDALYDAAVEDGIYSIDDAGILITCFDHPDVEFTQGSAMRELGVTCVDCHMPVTVDEETGETYTSHNAQQSPLENPTALEYCLTCHKSQGIETAEQMVQMVRDLQAETAAIENELADKFDVAHELIANAAERSDVDSATLDQCRDDYSHAEAYYHATLGSGDAGVKVAHNPAATKDYNARTGALLDGIIEALS